MIGFTASNLCATCGPKTKTSQLSASDCRISIGIAIKSKSASFNFALLCTVSFILFISIVVESPPAQHNTILIIYPPLLQIHLLVLQLDLLLIEKSYNGLVHEPLITQLLAYFQSLTFRLE